MKPNKLKKIVLLSLGGSVGKTLITTQLLHTFLPHAKILCVDGTNQTAKDFGIDNCEEHSGDKFNNTYRVLMSSKFDLIVDVGGSKECQQFLDGMLAIDGSDEVTTFIIPSKPDSKDQDCAIQTINRLLIDNVPKEKIRVVFTGVKASVNEEYQQLITGMLSFGLVPNLDLMIVHSPLYDEMIRGQELISTILADETDYKEMIADHSTDDETDYADKFIRRRMAEKTVWPNLQAVYKNLFSEV